MAGHSLRAALRLPMRRVANSVSNPRIEAGPVAALCLALCRVKRLIRPVGAPICAIAIHPTQRTLHARRHS